MEYRKIHLFIAGYGTVSKVLVEIIRTRRDFLKSHLGKELLICGLCNSKKFILDANGITLGFQEYMIEQLSGGKDISISQNSVQDKISVSLTNYITEACNLNLINSIFVDCTASKEISLTYTKLFKNGFSVVTCNKIANSLGYDSYCKLISSAVSEGVNYHYETTVCAALPVLATIRQIINSGDRVIKIEGILSGTLNYLFSSYNTEKSFATLVKKAKALGYTEPDPRVDLGGKDVLRKFIISAREAGEAIEESEIEFNNFLPDSLLQQTGATFTEDEEKFYSLLEAEEINLKALFENAAAQGRKLRFATTLDRSRVGEKPLYRVGLIEVDPSHPFFTLEGSDNAMLITTDFYPNGIVIKGAGAGARQTAGGLLNDILK